MWHEARKQERLIRGMIVDYRRRAERRKDFYEKIKAEPTQFLQLHGRQCKIHLDPAVAAAGEGPAIMMPWQGDHNNMIDRFDVRAHLDYIPDIKAPDIPPEELSTEERQCNYERYRILAQNVFLGISEDKFLQQLAIEEQFGVTIEEKESQKEKLSEKKGSGVAIGYNYNDPGAQPSSITGSETKKVEQKDSDDDSDLEIIDVDLSIDVNKMEASQAHELNAVGPQFGMAGCDLFSFLTGDADDAEHQKQLMREEKEKAMFSGRKSRRERRAHRDKKLATRPVSPPSYAAPRVRSRSPSRSDERSPTPDAAPTFITSFGPDEDDKPGLPPKPLYADKLKLNLKKNLLYSEVAAKTPKRTKPRLRTQIGPRMPGSRSHSESRSRSSSRSRSRSPVQSWGKSRSRSKSRSGSSRSRSRSPYRRTRSRSRSRSGSRSRKYGARRSRSPTNHASGYPNRHRSSSISYDSERTSQNKPTLPRYYGRRKEDKSSSELSLDSDSSDSADTEKNKSTIGTKTHSNQSQLRLSGASSKGPSKETLTMKERLKRKMQAQLAKQLRLDKRAEAQRQERERGRQARRDEEMRELAIKLRRRQREMRHQQYRRSSDEDDSDRSRSGSSSRHSPIPEKKRVERSRTKSKTPEERVLPIKEPSPMHKSRSDIGEHSQYARRRINDPPEPYPRDEDRGRRYEEDRTQNYPNKYEKYSRDYRNYDNMRHDNHERYEDKGPGPSSRRAHEQKSYRPQGSKFIDQGQGSGPSNWRSREDSQEREASGSYRKVKLVDY